MLQRGADSIGNGLYVLVAGWALAAIAGLCAALSVVLMSLMRALGKGFETRQHSAATAPTARNQP